MQKIRSIVFCLQNSHTSGHRVQMLLFSCIRGKFPAVKGFIYLCLFRNLHVVQMFHILFHIKGVFLVIIGQLFVPLVLCYIKLMDCQHFFRQIFLGYFSDIVQAFDTLRKNVCGDDYTSLHNPIVLSSVLPAYGMFHSIQILFL